MLLTQHCDIHVVVMAYYIMLDPESAAHNDFHWLVPQGEYFISHDQAPLHAFSLMITAA